MLLFAGCEWLNSIFTNDKKQKEGTVKKLKKKHSSYDPMFHTHSGKVHYLLKIKYANGNYLLDDSSLYKIPGKYEEVPVNGTFNIRLLNEAGATLHSISSNPPNEFIVDDRPLNDSANTFYADTISFVIKIPDNIGKIAIVQFMENNILKSSVEVPDDTIDFLKAVKSAPMDSTLFFKKQ